MLKGTFTAHLLALLAVVLAGCDDDPSQVTIKGETYQMEFAVSEEEIERGMGGRDSFPEGGGMLFIFPDSQRRSFWMYDCLIDIDIIFVNSLGVVVATHEMKAEPLRGEDESETEYGNRLKRYPSRAPAQFAIELEAGTIERLGVQVDDRIDMDLERLKALAR